MYMKCENYLQQVEEETLGAIDSSIEEIEQRDNNTLVNITGRISFTGTSETVNVRGKTLTKQEALFTDNSGSLRLVLWEQACIILQLMLR